MGAAENIQTVKSVYEAFGRGEVEAILATVADDVDWATETTSDGAPWYGVRSGKAGVASFFEDFGKTMEVEHFEPLAFAADGDDVMTVVRFVARSRETGRSASMDLHHWFRFRDGKIARYRGTEDTAITVATLV
jgi:hypothetical protein